MWNESKVAKTKKWHRCAWCEGEIDSGSSAITWSSIYEGDFCWGYMHPECHSALSECWKTVRGEIEFGDFTRGRTDGKNLPPQFNPDGSRTDEPINKEDIESHMMYGQ